ncbi:hypothetical protein BGZ46_003950, partial [Entomortierella lignicola]
LQKPTTTKTSLRLLNIRTRRMMSSILTCHDKRNHAFACHHLLFMERPQYLPATRHTPPYAGGSAESSPELSTISPPSPPDFTLAGTLMEQEADSFFTNVGTTQDILFSSLQEGKSIPSWAKNRPLYTFILQLKEAWGLRVTSLYEAAKTKPILDHTHLDEIALLSGIVHLNKNHIGFSQSEMSKISGEVLNMFYSKEMEDADMKRAEDATILWANWVQKLKLDQLKERLAAQRDGREPVDISVEPLIETILSSYADSPMPVQLLERRE